MKANRLWLKMLYACVGLLGLASAGCRDPKTRVVLYCAQDQEFAELVLGEFTRRTALRVVRNSTPKPTSR
jgi:hypothetical protein